MIITYLFLRKPTDSTNEVGTVESLWLSLLMILPLSFRYPKGSENGVRTKGANFYLAGNEVTGSEC